MTRAKQSGCTFPSGMFLTEFYSFIDEKGFFIGDFSPYLFLECASGTVYVISPSSFETIGL